MLLGIPQQRDTLIISPFKPTKGKSNNDYYYAYPSIELYSLHFFFINNLDAFDQKSIMNHDHGRSLAPDKMLGTEIILGNYTISRGKDEFGQHYISYFDKWDLSPDLPLIGEIEMDALIGKSLEIYNRIYFDPETGDVITPKQLIPIANPTNYLH